MKPGKRPPVVDRGREVLAALQRRMQFIFSVVAAILVVLSISPVFLFVESLIVGQPDYAKSYKYGEKMALVVTNYQETGRALLQAALTLIAASWGVVAVQKDHAAVLLQNWNTRFVFLAGTVCLALSCFSYLRFNYDLTYYLQIAAVSGSMPDLMSSWITGHLNAQIFAMTAGALCIGMTVIAATWFQPKPGVPPHV